jgi:hypothetical protein
VTRQDLHPPTTPIHGRGPVIEPRGVPGSSRPVATTTASRQLVDTRYRRTALAHRTIGWLRRHLPASPDRPPAGKAW